LVVQVRPVNWQMAPPSTLSGGPHLAGVPEQRKLQHSAFAPHASPSTPHWIWHTRWFRAFTEQRPLQHSGSAVHAAPRPRHVPAAKLQRPVVGLQLVQQVTSSSVFTQFSPGNWQRSWLFPTKPHILVAVLQLLEQQSAFEVQAPPCERQSEPQMPLRHPSEQHSSARAHRTPSAEQ
jgi:hypothetical protein